MKFVQLQDEEFDTFVQHHPLGNFLQSTAIGKRRQASGWQTHIVGVKDDGEIIAAALLHARRILGSYSDFECQQGPILDYNNTELVKYFFSSLRRYLKTQKALQLMFNPPLLLAHRNNDAERVNDSYDGARYVSLLESLGAQQQSNQRIDKDPVLLRWYFAKDMTPYHTEAELLESFDTQTRWSVRKTQKAGIEVVVCDPDNLDAFYAIMEHTGKRRQFAVRDKQYYVDLARHFGPQHVQFCLAQLNLETYRKNLQQLKQQEEQALKEVLQQLATQSGDKKLATQKRVRQEAINGFTAKIEQVKEFKKEGETLILAGAIFVHYGNELVYLNSGAYDRFSSFNAPYALQWYAMTYAISHGILRYNFYGTKGDFSGNPEQHGVYKFKKGFGGVVEEQIGYFILPIRPFYRALRGIVSTVRRAL